MDRLRKEASKEAGEEEPADRLRRDAADESKARRDRLAAEEEELRKQSEEADRVETEAKAASTLMANQYSQVLAAKLEEDEKWNALMEDIAREEASAKEKDAAARRKHLGSAVE